MRLKLGDLSLKELMEEILDKNRICQRTEMEDTEEADARLENIDELITKIVTYEEGTEHPELSGFLEEVARWRILTVWKRMTTGAPDDAAQRERAGISQSLSGGYGRRYLPQLHVYRGRYEEEIEEERRLCYVGITRAMERT